MGQIFSIVGRGFRSIMRFSGRDTLSQFWIYAAAVVATAMIAMMGLIGPMVNSSLDRMQRFAAEHPDQATVTNGPGGYSISIHGSHPELMPDFTGVILGMSAIVAVATALLAAAIVRRLHDGGRSGLWALPPAIFLAASLVMMPRLFSSITEATAPDMSLFGTVMIDNLLYLAALAALVIQLVSDGTRGPNRYGADPRQS